MTSENGIFQKSYHPLNKVALRNLCEVELGVPNFLLFFTLCYVSDIIFHIKQTKKERKKERDQQQEKKM